MHYFLIHLPDFWLFLLLSLSTILISIIFTLIIRVWIPAKIRSHDNAIIVGTSNLISVIYGVLVGISALYLVNNNSYTADAVQREANAVADVYRDSKWLPITISKALNKKLVIYLDTVISKEWPLMRAGASIDNQNDFLIDSMTTEVLQFSPIKNNEIILQKNILSNLQNLYNARQQRIHMSYELLNPDLWMVIIIGTILMLFINFIYDMNFYLHLVTITAAALMSSAMIFLLIALDGPFQGDFAIGPGAMHAVQLFIKQDTGRSYQISTR